MTLELQNVANARDLGGIVTKHGTVQHNRLLRSGHLSIVSQQDKQTLLQHNLQRVVDLRTPTEIANHPDQPIDGVQSVNISIMSATTFGISYETLDGAQIAVKLEAGIKRMLDRGETPIDHMRILYRKFVEDEHSRRGYGEFLRLLAENPIGGATLWHCTGGKDRCGTCTALLLYCLGADDQAIMKDYIQTNVQTGEHAQSLLAKVQPFVPTDRMPLVKSMLLVETSYLESFWQQIDRLFGSRNNFLRDCGVTDRHISLLQANYLQ